MLSGYKYLDKEQFRLKELAGNFDNRRPKRVNNEIMI